MGFETFKNIAARSGGGVIVGYPLQRFTTMRIGGPARCFARVKREKDLIEAIAAAEAGDMKWLVVGDGSNLIPSDGGFDGLVIKNEIGSFERAGERAVVGAGANLLDFIKRLNRLGLAGMEKMAGIPGTVGGAIYGCAGAYGEEIKDCLTRVKIFDADSVTRLPPRPNFPGKFGRVAMTRKPIRWLTKAQCRFAYRESIFKKKKNWIILGAEFKFKKGSPKTLQKISRDIIKLREQKYWPGLLCPGSFFKNIVLRDIQPATLRKKFTAQIPPENIIYGKVPTGYLLEVVGAKDMKQGGIEVAKHHANLIFNTGRGTAKDIRALAQTLKQKVEQKFGITLEEEVQYI